MRDVVGIGFGPANLALAVAMEETATESPLDRLFLETKDRYVWHPGMLIKDSLLQITVIKDLIMVENPRSRFTFLNYLKEKGRLYEFLNLRDLYPTRLEFNDYLTWAAEQLNERVRYGRRVTKVEPVDAAGRPVAPGEQVDLLRIEAEDSTSGAREQHLSRNLVLAAGGVPTAPNGIELRGDPRVVHSHHFLQGLKPYSDPEAPYRFVVVGSGQSAGEIFLHLIRNFPNADVTATIRRFAYKPVDESDFTNRIFFPEWVDYFHGLPAEKRRRFFQELKDVNYAVIDHALIRDIYKTLYRQKVLGDERARVHPFLELEAIDTPADGPLGARFHDLMTEETVTHHADGVFLCTGYAWQKEHPLLADVAPHLERDDRGGYRVERDYGLAAVPSFGPRVYLQGYCEDTHGISETVLSLLPVRARDIHVSIQGSRPKVPVLTSIKVSPSERLPREVPPKDQEILS